MTTTSTTTVSALGAILVTALAAGPLLGCGGPDAAGERAAAALDGIGSINTYPFPGMYPFANMRGTIGQTFVVPGGGTLTKLKFSVFGTDTLELYLAGWDGAAIIDPVVDEGSFNPNATNPWVTMPVKLPAPYPVADGKQYIFFFTGRPYGGNFAILIPWFPRVYFFGQIMNAGQAFPPLLSNLRAHAPNDWQPFGTASMDFCLEWTSPTLPAGVACP
jgi:hypothetical protein